MSTALDQSLQDRQHAARIAIELFETKGEEVTRADLIASGRLSRRQVEQLFENDDDLFEATIEIWFEPLAAIMEEVVNADLPTNRKMYEFFVRRFRVWRSRYQVNPRNFALLCELGAARFEKVRGFVDLADHYLCEIIAQAQADGFFAGLEIDETLSLINQMVANYTMPDALLYIDERLSEDKLARIVDTIFAGLSAEDGGALGVNALRLATQ